VKAATAKLSSQNPKIYAILKKIPGEYSKVLGERTGRFSTISLTSCGLLAATAALDAYGVMDFRQTAPILPGLPSATVAQDFSPTLE